MLARDSQKPLHLQYNFGEHLQAPALLNKPQVYKLNDTFDNRTKIRCSVSMMKLLCQLLSGVKAALSFVICQWKKGQSHLSVIKTALPLTILCLIKNFFVICQWLKILCHLSLTVMKTNVNCQWIQHYRYLSVIISPMSFSSDHTFTCIPFMLQYGWSWSVLWDCQESLNGLCLQWSCGQVQYSLLIKVFSTKWWL